MVKRLIIIVLDSVGIGYLEDADKYGDVGANTLGHIAQFSKNLFTPNMINLGLGNIDMNNNLPKSKYISGSYTRSAQKSAGKDTTTGHWEIAGVVLEQPFPVFENGFPSEVIKTFEKSIGSEIIGNYAASGTEIINNLGDEHCLTKKPIVYTSADSVFQIAMHEDIYPIQKQYEICTVARNILQGEFGVGRVIARPFTGTSGNYTRTKNRKDFSITPPETLLDALCEQGHEVLGIGKIYDIFGGKGISTAIKTADNTEGINHTIEAITNWHKSGLIFTNLVDFDMLYGHRRDIEGYAKCLNEFDKRLPEILNTLKDDDILIITADHGNDPSFKGTDHTREYIPVLIYGSKVKKNNRISDRTSFADIAATVSDFLGIKFVTEGESFLAEIITI
jgi:phosphopentomutase